MFYGMRFTVCVFPLNKRGEEGVQLSGAVFWRRTGVFKLYEYRNKEVQCAVCAKG